ncbi:MAG: alcohol dehydrogenase [Alphaproteobacteria bacterium]|nr:MAG: alcohol dehydrogenase [Alphaproteobacteria bacterium]
MQGNIICTAMEKVTYGQPAAQAVKAEAERLNARRVFLLVSRSLNHNTNEIKKIRDALGARYVGEYEGIPSHAPRSAVILASAKARDLEADLIVAVGGGSVVDAGKIMLICLKHGLTSPDELDPFHVYVNDAGDVIDPDFDGPDIRMIAVPTTLSGGEFNPLGGATDEVKKLKQGYQHRLLVPVTVILDPEITRHTPEWLWMSTGIRSLDHALETLGSFQSNDYCDGIADSAIRLLIEGLPRVKKNPKDFEARLKCQIGVWQSMVPVVAGVPMGASHAIGHVLGGTCDVPHGYTSCVMAPFVLDYNAEVNADRQKRISTCFGDENRSASFHVDHFIRELGMPRSLREVDIKEQELKLVAENTMLDFWARTNPRPINGAENILDILKMAF